MKKYITINLQYEATHYWKECEIKDVLFLKNEHRHIFFIKCYKEVLHNNRDIEIILFKNKILKYLQDKFKNKFENMSCEDIAENLITEFKLSECEVLEDNENGANLKKTE